MNAQSTRILCSGLLALSLSPGLALAGDAVWLRPNLTQAQAASFARPYVMAVPEVKTPRPQWADGRLLAEKPKALRGLARVDRAGHPAFDPATQAFYASADGALVRVDPDGSLPVMADDVQGLDLDVRAERGLAVSREPSDQIVLHVFRGGENRKRVLLTGGYFFNPRLSPDGTRVLVAESRAAGGHMWLIDTSSGEARDLGQGYDATWHPDGKRIVFVRIEHDGTEVLASTVFLLDLATRRETALTRTEGELTALAPAVSPDGKLLAYASARGGAIHLAPLPQGGGR